MALVLADRVLETSTSEGLGTFALAGAQTGYQTFSNGIGNGNTCYYTINGQTTEQWEVGIGTVGAGTLARTTLISSNTGSFINFVAGVKNVFVTQPASKSIYKDANGDAIPLGSASATQLDITAQGDLRLQDTTGGEYVALQAPATIATSYTLTLPVDDGTAGQALVTDGSGVLSWSTAASGDVYGPASATDNAVARYDGTTGKIIQNSAVTIADDGATVIAANSASDALRITQIGAGNAILVEDSANPDATPFVVAADGTVITGNTTSVNNLNPANGVEVFAQIQVAGTNVPSAMIAASMYSTTSTNIIAPYVSLGRSNTATVGDDGLVASGDLLGGISFHGNDGAAQKGAALIQSFVDGTPSTGDMPGRLVFSTTADGASTPTERMRITNDGRVGIGGVPGTNFSVVNSKSITGATTQIGYGLSATILSDVTTLVSGYRSLLATQAAAFTLTNLYHYEAIQSTFGATSTVTNQYGFVVGTTLIGATNNYGFYGNIASGTGRWNFYAAGTADNYFAGNTGIGTASLVGGWKLEVAPAAAGAALRLRGGSGGSSITQFTDSGASAQWGTLTATSASINLMHNAILTFTTNTVERLRIASTGVISLGAAPGSESLSVTPVASAVNYLQVAGATSAGPVTVAAQGSDTNINLYLVPKGAGVLQFGTYTAGIVAQAGYITIKDEGNNTRRLLVG